MGSSASKGAKAAGAAARKYPSRAPNATTRPPLSQAPPSETTNAKPSASPPPQASESKTDAVDLDARDPGLAARLSELGAVQPNPHYSPTSTSSYDPQRNPSSTFPSDMMQAPPASAFPSPRDNPALRVLEARQKIQDEADEESSRAGRKGFEGRKYVDVGLVQLALMRRQHGEPDARIEQSLGIKKGRLSRLDKNIVDTVQSLD